NEIWDYSLVDPDNRRPVDYKRRREMLDALPGATPEELVWNWPDGRIKMFLTQQVLQFRREHVDLFRRGEYLPLTASGTFGECCGFDFGVLRSGGRGKLEPYGIMIDSTARQSVRSIEN